MKHKALLERHTGLYTDFYELTMAQGYFLTGRTDIPACFDYFFRTIPFQGGYVIFSGLYDLLSFIENLKFDENEIVYLESLGFDKRFLEYLKEFHFRGDIYSFSEGEIAFPYEPLLRVEGNIIEAQIVETVVLNILNFESLITTKAVRIKQAAGDKTVIDFGLRRAQGFGGIHASRAAGIGGILKTSNVYSAYIFGLEPSGTMAHSWVQSFDDELSAFREFARIYPEKSVLLVDTYDTLNSGIPNAIKVAKELEKKGYRLVGIRIDSGDLAYLSKKARKMLDEAKLNYVKIIVSNQLDEYVIKSLVEQNAPIDVFGVGTRLVTGYEDGALDGIYKLSMSENKPRLKKSETVEKIGLPGIKKTVRFINDEGKFYADAIMLNDENKINEIFRLK